MMRTLKLSLILLLPILMLTGQILASDPSNLAECRQMLSGQLIEKCNQLFGKAEQAEFKKSCLANIEVGLKTCDEFFGAGQDFCGTCSRNCISQYEASSPKRKDCLDMCLKNKACQK